jgi:hypothetical protein
MSRYLSGFYNSFCSAPRENMDDHTEKASSMVVAYNFDKIDNKNTWMVMSEKYLAAVFVLASVHVVDITWGSRMFPFKHTITIRSEYHGIGIVSARINCNSSTEVVVRAQMEALKNYGQNSAEELGWLKYSERKSHFITDFQKSIINAMLGIFNYEVGAKRGQVHLIFLIVKACKSEGYYSEYLTDGDFRREIRLLCMTPILPPAGIAHYFTLFRRKLMAGWPESGSLVEHLYNEAFGGHPGTSTCREISFYNTLSSRHEQGIELAHR